MKTIKYILLAICIVIFVMSFYGCGSSGEDPKSKREELTEYLVNKGEWTLQSISVPSNTATIEDDWVNFSLTVSNSSMNTSGHPQGAQAVWPSGGWTMDEDGKIITRSDGIVMVIVTLNASTFKVSFSVPGGAELGSRIMALDGDYIFELE